MLQKEWTEKTVGGVGGTDGMGGGLHALQGIWTSYSLSNQRIMFSDLPIGKLNLATLWKIEWIVERLKTESAVKLRSKSFLNLFKTNMGDKLTSGDLLRLWGYSATSHM